MFRETKMHDDGRILLAVLNLYVRFNISVATFDTNHSVTVSTHTFAASIQKLPDSAVKSAGRARVRVDMSCQTVGLAADLVHVTYMKGKQNKM